MVKTNLSSKLLFSCEDLGEVPQGEEDTKGPRNIQGRMESHPSQVQPRAAHSYYACAHIRTPDIILDFLILNLKNFPRGNSTKIVHHSPDPQPPPPIVPHQPFTTLNVWAGCFYLPSIFLFNLQIDIPF